MVSKFLKKICNSPSPKPLYRDVEMVMVSAYELNLLQTAVLSENETERKEAKEKLQILYAWKVKK